MQCTCAIHRTMADFARFRRAWIYSKQNYDLAQNYPTGSDLILLSVSTIQRRTKHTGVQAFYVIVVTFYSKHLILGSLRPSQLFSSLLHASLTQNSLIRSILIATVTIQHYSYVRTLSNSFGIKCIWVELALHNSQKNNTFEFAEFYLYLYFLLHSWHTVNSCSSSSSRAYSSL